MTNLQARYKEKLRTEGWQEDKEQLNAVAALQRLVQDLKRPSGFWPFKKKIPTKGVYLYGGVGRGKSMLMDLFFDYAPAKIQKRRVHFHEFMIETHDWLHANRGDQMDDLLPSYARHVSGKTKLLCFDEFHVTNVVDAMILGRLFTALLERDVVIVATSNWRPDYLYEGGLQRDLFLPFIALLQSRLEIVHLDSKTDYRQISAPDQDIYYYYPLNQKVKDKINALFIELAMGATTKRQSLKVKGRTLKIDTLNDVARTSFSQLCEQPLGAEDYIKLAQNFDTIFIENIPHLNAERRNEAKRFILLIDCLYEAQCRVVLSAENDIHALYDGHDHAFEFDRTISRLLEMQSAAYHEKRVKRVLA